MANVDIEKVVSPTFTHKFDISHLSKKDLEEKYSVSKGMWGYIFEDIHPRAEITFKCGWRYTHPEIKDEDEKETHWIALFAFVGNKYGRNDYIGYGVCKVITTKDENGIHRLSKKWLDGDVEDVLKKLFVRGSKKFSLDSTFTIQKAIQTLYEKVKEKVKYKSVGVEDIIKAFEDNTHCAIFCIRRNKDTCKDLLTWREGYPTPHIVEVFTKDVDDRWLPFLTEYKRLDEVVDLSGGWDMMPLVIDVELNNILPKHLKGRFTNADAMFSIPKLEIISTPIMDYEFKSEIFKTPGIVSRTINKIVQKDFGIYKSKAGGWDEYIYLVKRTKYVPSGEHSTFAKQVLKYDIYGFPMNDKSPHKEMQFNTIELSLYDAHEHGGCICKDIQLQIELYSDFKITLTIIGTQQKAGEVITSTIDRKMDVKVDLDHLINSGMLVEEFNGKQRTDEKKNKSSLIDWTYRTEDRPSDMKPGSIKDITDEQAYIAFKNWMEEHRKKEEAREIAIKEGFELHDRISKSYTIAMSERMIEDIHAPVKTLIEDGLNGLPPYRTYDEKYNGRDIPYNEIEWTMIIKFEDEETGEKINLRKSDLHSFLVVKEGGLNDEGDGILVENWTKKSFMLRAIIEMIFKHRGEHRSVIREFTWYEDNPNLKERIKKKK